ncbi:MAG: alanine racemase [Candidatus Paceibacterota bacterium]|jgi:alanine racemase
MQKDINRKGLRTWIEIDKKALKYNYGVLQGMLPKNVKLMSVVKSNAYGHGLVDFSLEAQQLGIDWFGVDSIVEAIALREAGITKPILVLGYTLPEMLIRAVKHNISITVSTFELLENISKMSFSTKIKVHIKVDTGMHRQGFQEDEIEKVVVRLKELKSKVEVEGLFTHFAGVKNSKFSELTNKQLQSFKLWVDKFKKEKFTPIIHAGASSVVFIFPEAYFDMVRVGIAQYGLWPSKDVKRLTKQKTKSRSELCSTTGIKLKPILQWKTLVGEIKKVPKGNRVGYDFTEEFKKNSTIAVCPIGYWHGYPRSLSSVGNVLVRGKRAKVLGRVSMDMIVVDVSNISKVKVRDEVTLIGSGGKGIVSAEEVADLAGASLYEIVTRINPLIKRVYF